MPASEPDLAMVERRLATLHQERRFRPGDPWWTLFTPAELKRLVFPEETK